MENSRMKVFYCLFNHDVHVENETKERHYNQLITSRYDEDEDVFQLKVKTLVLAPF